MAPSHVALKNVAGLYRTSDIMADGGHPSSYVLL